MGLINRFKNRSQVVTRYKMITEIGNGYYSWDGNVYRSDLVRACIRPKVKAIGKLTAKHIRKSYSRNGDGSIEINPEPYMRMLLEEPNISTHTLTWSVTPITVMSSSGLKRFSCFR